MMNSSIASSGVHGHVLLGKEETQIRSRIDYINDILSKLYDASQSCYLQPTSATEDSIFEQALGCIVHAVNVSTNKGGLPLRGYFSSSCSTRAYCPSSTNAATTSTWNRKQCLKEMLDKLNWMERRRLYGPPADNEIGDYLLIKKYMRPLLAYFSHAPAISRLQIRRRAFGCASFFRTLHHAEELADLNQHLADISATLLKNDFTRKPIMEMEDDGKMALLPLIHGSKERNYKFYAHKFLLAMIDLQCCEYAFVPPFEDEKAAYLQVLACINLPPLNGLQDEMTSYSGVLNQLFLERIYEETSDVMSHCEKIRDRILKDLTLTNCWEFLQGKYGEEKYEEWDNDSDYLAEFKKALAEKCQDIVSDDELPNYISRLERCVTIATNMLIHIMGIIEDESSTFRLNDIDESVKAWEALHALTLLKRRRSRTGDLEVLHPDDQQQYMDATEKSLLPAKSKDENVQLLRAIIEDLKHIGISLNDQQLVDEEETALAQKIWGSVASSIHFFISALAYEQKSSLMHRSDLLSVQVLRLHSSKENININMKELIELENRLPEDMRNLVGVLEIYKEILVGKLTS